MPKRGRPRRSHSTRIAYTVPRDLLAWIDSEAELLRTSRSRVISLYLEAARSSSQPESDPIAAALIEAGGNVSKVARRLGVPRSTLRYWIQWMGLEELVEELRE